MNANIVCVFAGKHKEDASWVAATEREARNLANWLYTFGLKAATYNQAEWDTLPTILE